MSREETKQPHHTATASTTGSGGGNAAASSISFSTESWPPASDSRIPASTPDAEAPATASSVEMLSTAVSASVRITLGMMAEAAANLAAAIVSETPEGLIDAIAIGVLDGVGSNTKRLWDKGVEGAMVLEGR